MGASVRHPRDLAVEFRILLYVTFYISGGFYGHDICEQMVLSGRCTDQALAWQPPSV